MATPDYADALATEVPLDDAERELLRRAHRWLAAYCERIKDPPARPPAPRGTAHEAWATLTLVSMLMGYGELFPALQVREAVPTPPDFQQRVAALVRRLEEKA